jgi:hypothetical protein
MLRLTVSAFFRTVRVQLLGPPLPRGGPRCVSWSQTDLGGLMALTVQELLCHRMKWSTKQKNVLRRTTNRPSHNPQQVATD